MALIEALGATLLASKFAKIAIAIGILLALWATVFPVVSLPADVESAFETVGGYLGPFGKMVPITAIFTVIGLILLFEAGFLLFKIFNWAWALGS